MSRLKRSRALRRNLRKQARKGTLSAREQKTLLSQEKKFRKARRPLMKGLGFGAGLGAGALLVPGVAGLISGLGGLRKDDPENEQPEGERPEDMREFGGEMKQAGEIELGSPQDRVLMGDIQVVGETPDEATRAVGEEVEGDGEEAPSAEEAPAAEERQATPEDQARAERAAQRAERSREAGVDAALEAGLGGPDRPYTNYEDPEEMGATRATGSVNRLLSNLADMEGLSANSLLSDLSEMEGPSQVTGLLDDLSPGRFEELRGARPVAPDRMQARPASQLPVDRPDPRMNTVFDPRLPGAIDRALRSPLFMQQGGRVDKSNDLVARIKRKYGLR